MIWPVYSTEYLDKNTRLALVWLGLHAADEDAEGDMELAIKCQYVAMMVSVCLIVSNLRSFLRMLLVSLKYLLADSEIQLSF